MTLYRRDDPMTSASTEKEPTCVVCGRGLDGADGPLIRPNLVGVAVAVHRSCLDAYRERVSKCGDAWARSPRGRLALGWLRVRLATMIVVAAIVSLVGVIPVAMTMSARSWRLRRIVRRQLGDLKALVVVHAPREGDAGAIFGAFGESWARANQVRLRFIGAEGDPSTTPDDRAIWRHWRPNHKVGSASGVVFVPRAGRVHSWDLLSMRGGENRSDRIASVRRAIECALDV
jgi:hypothetical protein